MCSETHICSIFSHTYIHTYFCVALKWFQTLSNTLIHLQGRLVPFYLCQSAWSTILSSGLNSLEEDTGKVSCLWSSDLCIVLGVLHLSTGPKSNSDGSTLSWPLDCTEQDNFQADLSRYKFTKGICLDFKMPMIKIINEFTELCNNSYYIHV